eukprot:8887465-Alexandrium_andersonii.AAC.1
MDHWCRERRVGRWMGKLPRLGVRCWLGPYRWARGRIATAAHAKKVARLRWSGHTRNPRAGRGAPEVPSEASSK